MDAGFCVETVVITLVLKMLETDCATYCDFPKFLGDNEAGEFFELGAPRNFVFWAKLEYKPLNHWGVAGGDDEAVFRGRNKCLFNSFQETFLGLFEKLGVINPEGIIPIGFFCRRLYLGVRQKMRKHFWVS